jgi:hypothetical protein
MEEKSKITLVYVNGFTGQNITLTKEYNDDSLGYMEEFVEFFRSAALAVGFSENLVKEYLGLGEL